MGNTPIKSVLIAATAAASFFISGCSAEKKATAPPKTGTLAYTWHTATESYKAGNYQRSMEQLTRLATAQSEYRTRARLWLVVVAGGIADGYLQLSNAYEDGARLSKAASSDYRNQVRELRNIANTAALAFAETMHDIMDENKDPRFAFDFGFPAGGSTEPLQLAKIRKGLPMQAADHEVARKKMAEAGVVKFAALLAGSPSDIEKARQQFAAPSRDAVLMGVATNLVSSADLYSQKKMDIPKRGNALCKEAAEALALLPDSKEKKALDTKAKDALKKFKVES
jgi:hypothetical protein